MGDRWVCLDVGETLIDETRVWTCWAEVLGITPLTFMASMGAVLAQGRQFDEVFAFVGVTDRDIHRAAFTAAYGGFQERDLYPDAKPALDALRGAGYRLAIIANQPAERLEELRFLGVRADVMGMSAEMGVHKPAPEFYAEALRRMNDPAPADVAYVGDRLDNDIHPAAAAGMRPVWIKRGPWAAITTDTPPAGTLVVDSLDELVKRIDEAWA
ncbi:MAG TPA: HAD-IIIA family hydrolase [Candidatus Limnocylindria bacterium]|nr:HAD-IIIA family hydrolase [Candidatus Limnocylindria bacterium]